MKPKPHRVSSTSTIVSQLFLLHDYPIELQLSVLSDYFNDEVQLRTLYYGYKKPVLLTLSRQTVHGYTHYSILPLAGASKKHIVHVLHQLPRLLAFQLKARKVSELCLTYADPIGKRLNQRLVEFFTSEENTKLGFQLTESREGFCVIKTPYLSRNKRRS